MELNRLLGDQEELERCYREYLALLKAHRRFNMILSGGYTVVDTSLLWGRAAEAEGLARRWLEAIALMPDLDPGSTLRFVRRELALGNDWGMIRLMDEFGARPGLPAEVVSALAMIRGEAMNRLRISLREAEGGTSEAARVQAEWAALSLKTEQPAQLATEEQSAPEEAAP